VTKETRHGISVRQHRRTLPTRARSSRHSQMQSPIEAPTTTEVRAAYPSTLESPHGALEQTYADPTAALRQRAGSWRWQVRARRSASPPCFASLPPCSDEDSSNLPERRCVDLNQRPRKLARRSHADRLRRRIDGDRDAHSSDRGRRFHGMAGAYSTQWWATRSADMVMESGVGLGVKLAVS
jgi:hypothetical protein